MAHGPKLFQLATSSVASSSETSLEPLDLLGPVAHLSLELFDRRGLSGASVPELSGAGLRGGAGRGDLVARSLDFGVELVGALLGPADSCDLVLHVRLELAHPFGHGAVGVLDAAEQLGPGRKVLEALGIEEDVDLVHPTRLVDLDEALAPRRPGRAPVAPASRRAQPRQRQAFVRAPRSAPGPRQGPGSARTLLRPHVPPRFAPRPGRRCRFQSGR